MWFRIEQNKDGSIATCSAVEGSRGDRGAVHYIEADTAESACKILLARRNLRKAVQGARKTARNSACRDSGICGYCAKPLEPERAGRSRCAACAAHAEKLRHDRLAGIRIRAEYATTPDKELTSELRLRAQQCAAAKRKASAYTIAKRIELQRCLEAFDRMTPRLFREWLAEELHKAREAEQASAQRRAARITKAA